MIRQANSEGMPVEKACKIMSVSKHQYYHKPLGGTRGVKPSTTTRRILPDGIVEEVDNQEVLKKIIAVKENDLKRYGYQKMTAELQFNGFIINSKKVYRLMGSQGILCAPRPKVVKEYVKFRIVQSTRPLEVIEMDIKHIKIIGTHHFDYILTVIDTFKRTALHWNVGLQMKQNQVKDAIESVVINHLQPAGLKLSKLKVELRSDNGSQFEAKKLMEFVKDNGIDQVFTHPYTPQENGHIESFHSILTDAIGTKQFDSLHKLETWLKMFYSHYNSDRIHGSICNLPPDVFDILYDNNFIDVLKKDQKVKLKLKIPMYQVKSTLVMIKEKKTITGKGSSSEPLSCKLNTSEGDLLLSNNFHAFQQIAPINSTLALANN